MSGKLSILAVLLCLAAGCAAPAPSSPPGLICARVSKFAMFTYGGTRCAVCHRSITAKDAPVYHVAFDGGPVLYAHRACWEEILKP